MFLLPLFLALIAAKTLSDAYPHWAGPTSFLLGAGGMAATIVIAMTLKGPGNKPPEL